MLHYFKFRQEFSDPQPAREIYQKRASGKGWPEECPPIRAANAYGFDLLANFDVTFIHSARNKSAPWRVAKDIVIESDFDWSDGDANAPDIAVPAAGKPLAQQYAWFWEKGQKLPHVISDNVYTQISNQVKVSTFLFLRTDPNELLYITAIPNIDRPWRPIAALIDTDWYPASYPWHCVLELSRAEKRITIRKGEPLCRIIPVKREAFFAQQMSPAAFDEFFARGQRWLATHGKRPAQRLEDPHDRPLDITRTYVKQQIKSKFVVMK